MDCSVVRRGLVGILLASGVTILACSDEPIQVIWDAAADPRGDEGHRDVASPEDDPGTLRDSWHGEPDTPPEAGDADESDTSLGPDVDEAAALCRPCTVDGDCGSSGPTCRDRGVLGRFCLPSCSSDLPCPAGYACEAQEESLVGVCVPEPGDCPCPPAGTGAMTSCTAANAHGSCPGSRTCHAGAWTPCSAATPGIETCDALDNDCDGQIDEAGARGCSPFYRDDDHDGQGNPTDRKCLCGASPPYTAEQGDDCDDTRFSSHVGAMEVCANRFDDDCDGQTDEPGCQGCIQFFRDADGDGYGLDADWECLPAPEAEYQGYRGGDCDDDDAAVNPARLEACNEKDDDCDRFVDETWAVGCSEWYIDPDGDGWGTAGASQCLCAPAAPFSAAAIGDCNPADASVHPGASETCNGRDDDCDGHVDPEGAVGCRTWFADLDGDGWGAEPLGRCLCDPQGFHIASSAGDCEPFDANIHPQATEACNGRDDDCDGIVDEGFADTDGDGTPDDLDPDRDGDAVSNEQDDCPDAANPLQENLDGDRFGDACDFDDDGDGVADTPDNCPRTHNADQKDLDADGLGDTCDADRDGDGVPDEQDDCPQIANPDQADCDADKVGNECDPDDDNDGVLDGNDNCPCKSNLKQGDSDGDGVGDACDPEECDGKDNDGDAKIDEDFPDQDVDGAADCVDPCPSDPMNDWDHDGLCPDADNCPFAANAAQSDQDQDGQGDACETGSIDGNWLTLMADARHTSHVAGTLRSADFRTGWVYALPFTAQGVWPLQADGKVVTVSSDGANKLLVIDAASGTLSWTRDFGAVAVGGAALDGDAVFITQCDHTGNTWVFRQGRLTGKPMLQAPMNAQWDTYYSPVIADGKLFVNGGSYGGMYAFDATTLAQLWFKSLPQYDEWSPGYRNQVAYAFVDTGLYALDAATGAQLWATSIPHSWSGYSMQTSVVLGTDKVIVTSNRSLHAVGYTSRTIDWTYSTPGTGIAREPAVDAGEVFVIGDGALHVVSESAGTVLWTWKAPDGTALTGSPALTDDFAFVATAKRTYGIRRSTRALEWEAPVGGRLAISTSGLYVLTDAGVVQQFVLRQ